MPFTPALITWQVIWPPKVHHCYPGMWDHWNVKNLRSILKACFACCVPHCLCVTADCRLDLPFPWKAVTPGADHCILSVYPVASCTCSRPKTNSEMFFSLTRVIKALGYGTSAFFCSGSPTNYHVVPKKLFPSCTPTKNLRSPHSGLLVRRQSTS